MSSSSSATRLRTWSPGRLRTFSPNPMLSATVMFGKRAYDWKTIPTLRLFGALPVISAPSMRIEPAVGVLEAGDHPEGRRLAAAGRAEERDELASRGTSSSKSSTATMSPNTLLRSLLELEDTPSGFVLSGQCAGELDARLRAPRPMTAMRTIATQVRPKLTRASAAGS